MSRLVDLALRRARRRGPLPKGTRREALILWSLLVNASLETWSNFLARVAPSPAALADGAVALARFQAERGIRTIVGRSLPGGGGR